MSDNKTNLSKIKKGYLNFLKKQEILGEPFYDKLGQLKNFYLPICHSIFEQHNKRKKITVIGISGGQGSGKSTMAEILKFILKKKYDLNSINFSIDDFYKKLNDREKMSKKIHKLFLTRGVPGTHDINLLIKIFKKLLRKNFKTLKIPKFDKSTDDRLPKKEWIRIEKKPAIIIFEGWCLGAMQQNNKILSKPINLLEKKYDKKLIWRKKVNNELKKNYKLFIELIDKLIFLEVPSFKHVFKWRLLQEKKLKFSSKGRKIMTAIQIKEFIMYYERITNQMIKDLRYKADITIKLDKKHKLNSIRIN